MEAVNVDNAVKVRLQEREAVDVSDGVADAVPLPVAVLEGVGVTLAVPVRVELHVRLLVAVVEGEAVAELGTVAD